MKRKLLCYYLGCRVGSGSILESGNFGKGLVDLQVR